MPYRELLELIAARLSATARGSDAGYETHEQFAADLACIDASLAAHRGAHAGQFALGRLIRRLQCFGFHLATLDLRQDSAIHDAALAALLQQPDYAARETAERATTLHRLIAGAQTGRASCRERGG